VVESRKRRLLIICNYIFFRFLGDSNSGLISPILQQITVTRVKCANCNPNLPKELARLPRLEEKTLVRPLIELVSELVRLF
jgi:hypothetical protein